MRLLLDEMWSPAIAQQLRQRGYDVAAVAERPALRSKPDSVAFAVAQVEGRAIVTENVIDYRLLASCELQHGGSHAGIIFTTDRRFSRRDGRTTGRIVMALDKLLASALDLAGAEYWLS